MYSYQSWLTPCVERFAGINSNICFFFLIQGQGQLNFNLLTFLKFEFFIVLDKRFQTKLSISSIAFFNLRKV